MKFVLTATAVLLFLGPNVALAAGPAGTFEGRGEGRISLSVSKSKNIEVTTTTGSVGCIGLFQAKGEMIGDRILQAKKEDFGKVCTVTIYFDNRFKNASIQEDNCVFFHGAACGFRGVVRRVR